MIEINNVIKTYGNKNVVDHVSTTIRKESITSFIGPNGAGKSTLLSMVSRLINKDGGEIYIEAREIESWDNNELSKKIAI